MLPHPTPRSCTAVDLLGENRRKGKGNGRKKPGRERGRRTAGRMRSIVNRVCGVYPYAKSTAASL